MKPRIVLSGVNFVDGGPLAVFQDALRALSECFLDKYEVTALVHRRDLFDIEGISYLEFPEVKGSWFRRLRFEYVDCRKLSRGLNPFLWLAMHDITPSVSASVRAVYCHNPAPFYDLPFREVRLDPTFALFRLFYSFLYAINIAKNDFVVVQQNWLREEFRRRFHLQNVVVAHPSLPPRTWRHVNERPDNNNFYVFFYPALPRSFKNVELLLESARILEQRGLNFEVLLTIDGSENRYAATQRKTAADLRTVRWLGKQKRDQVEAIYEAADCLLFPSKLETWGMPISEWKRTGKPMLVADLPYAQETVGNYDSVGFVDTQDPAALARRMSDMIQGQEHLSRAYAQPIEAPFANDWNELFQILLGDEKGHSASSEMDGKTSSKEVG